jgi:hypothetical protein
MEMINSGNIAAVIDAIYQALFNRQADAAGRDWILAEFNKGSFTAATIMLKRPVWRAERRPRDDQQQARHGQTVSPGPSIRSLTAAALPGNLCRRCGRRCGPHLPGPGGLRPASSVPTQSEITEYIKSYIADPGDSLIGQ